MARLKLRILTLNCWDLPLPWPFGSADRRLRINAIAQELSRDLWDVVALEEIWSQDDYKLIRDAVLDVLPNAVYFHSGYIGSGLCLFTKGQITSTFVHPYTLNGYAHHVHRGDWYGGKAVALARIRMREEWSVSVYVTHLHARYSERGDKYCAHRLVQAYELGQFISETSSNGSDLSLVLGDTNLEPDDVATKLLLSLASLRDAYSDASAAGQVHSREEGYTCGLASNSYTVVTSTLKAKRFDYIFYKAAADIGARVEKCDTTMGRIPTKPSINYSDHEAVCAEILVCKDTDDEYLERPRSVVGTKVIEDCISVIDAAIAHAKLDRRLYGYMALACITLFVLTFPLSSLVPKIGVLVMIIRLAVIVLLTFSFWNGVVMLKMEINALKGAKGGMKLHLDLASRKSENSSSSGSFEVCDENDPLLNSHKRGNGLNTVSEVAAGKTEEV